MFYIMLAFNISSKFFSPITAHENGKCVIYDVSARKPVTTFQPHSMDCRSIRFSPDSKYILTGSYDASIALTTVQYNLDTKIQLLSQTVATHKDKVIQCRWHPSQYTFLSSSADKTVALWMQEERWLLLSITLCSRNIQIMVFCQTVKIC